MPTVRYTTVEGEVIAEKRSGVRKHYVPDPLGSTVALLDSAQAQTDTFSYWPFGEVQTRTGTTLTPFLYNGTRGFHHDSGSQIYVDDRYLSTSLARWFTSDIDQEANGQNPYEYDLSDMQATIPGRKEMFFSGNASDKIDNALVGSCQLTIVSPQ
jgi:RHS repeat-associated protein